MVDADAPYSLGRPSTTRKSPPLQSPQRLLSGHRNHTFHLRRQTTWPLRQGWLRVTQSFTQIGEVSTSQRRLPIMRVPSIFGYRPAPWACAGMMRWPSSSSTLKLHMFSDRKEFASKVLARAQLRHWIEIYYNHQRAHSTTGQVPAHAMARFLHPSAAALQSA